jgi:hypothetical protein
VPNGDGGVSIEHYRADGTLESYEVTRDGRVLYFRFVSDRIVEQAEDKFPYGDLAEMLAMDCS